MDWFQKPSQKAEPVTRPGNTQATKSRTLHTLVVYNFFFIFIIDFWLVPLITSWFLDMGKYQKLKRAQILAQKDEERMSDVEALSEGLSFFYDFSIFLLL